MRNARLAFVRFATVTLLFASGARGQLCAPVTIGGSAGAVDDRAVYYLLEDALRVVPKDGGAPVMRVPAAHGVARDSLAVSPDAFFFSEQSGGTLQIIAQPAVPTGRPLYQTAIMRAAAIVRAPTPPMSSPAPVLPRATA